MNKETFGKVAVFLEALQMKEKFQLIVDNQF